MEVHVIFVGSRVSCDIFPRPLEYSDLVPFCHLPCLGRKFNSGAVNDGFPSARRWSYGAATDVQGSTLPDASCTTGTIAHGPRSYASYGSWGYVYMLVCVRIHTRSIDHVFGTLNPRPSPQGLSPAVHAVAC